MRSVLLAGLCAALVWFVALSLSVANARQELDQTLLLTTRAVEAEIDRLRALPTVAAQDARVRQALDGTGPLQQANAYLEMVADHTGADELFLIAATGETIAASNWNEPGSFVGQNYAFRPYFQEALSTGRGQFYAIGVTTGVPGYFLASRIVVGSNIGVMVVKAGPAPITGHLARRRGRCRAGRRIWRGVSLGASGLAVPPACCPVAGNAGPPRRDTRL